MYERILFIIFSIIIYYFIHQGSVMACEYLILNASNINVQDYDGRTPIFYATQLGKYFKNTSDFRFLHK